MAGASIGEAFISASIQVLCDRLTSREFIDLFRHKKLDQPLPMKLKVTLLTLNVVLNDAGEKQRENPAVREWLDELKHAVFDAEDLLDEINYEALRCKLEGDGQIDNLTNKVWNFLSTSHNHSYQSMNVKIQELLQRLEDFVQLKSALGLREEVGRKVSQKTPTTSLVHEPCVYGRDEVKENLSKMLLSDDASKDDVSVITIVGMGGVGKTTLARMLYNDHKVEEHFTLKAWACVSEDSKIDPNMKLLVVTCKNVASVMQNVPIQYLEPLSNEDCWLLLAKHAFGNESSSSHPSLEEIGRQIARKCNGLPLAAQTLGGVLRCKIDSEVWNRVLNNNIWELPYEKSDILPALGLSYHYLPAKLKRCFVYCSIFPKDYGFKIEDVVFLWMGEGLIPQAENGERMEEVAKEYFDELLSRSLFQKSWKSSFTMHDLINDLAVFMSKGVSYRLEGRESHELERVRYLSYVRGEFDIALKFEPLNEAKCLRTFLPTSLSPYRFYNPYYVSKKVLQDLVPSLKWLRVLSLSQYQNVTELPDTIENLIHLHYLDLSHIAIRKLPGVLCNLYNLQTLLLSDCSFLVELPADMRKLINLQKLMLAGCKSLTKLLVDMRELSNLHHLDVNGTKIAELPVEMGRLKSLRTLTAFVVGKSNGSGIGELRELKHLRGKLSILKLQNVVDARDALQANLKHKKDLKELELAWGAEDVDDSQKEKDVLDKLQPCENLEQLTIKFYGGANFPNWLGDSSFSNIQVMHLSDCSYCWSMPPVGELPALKELCIKRMKFVKKIGVEFYGRNGASLIQPFQSLEKLEFEEMPDWEEWIPSGSGDQYHPDFPCLMELILKKCPKLRGNLPCHMPYLEKLSVSGCGVLHDQRATTTTISSLNMYSYKSLEELKIEDGWQASLLSVIETRFLSELDIQNFVDIQCLPNINRLQYLALHDCPTPSSFPKDGLPTTLTALHIYGCRRLEFLPHEMLAKLTSLERLGIIESCDSMRTFPLGIFPKLWFLNFRKCQNLESFSIEGVDKNLRDLYIEDCPNLVCFPQGGLPASNLNHFMINGCNNLKSFPERIHTLTALRGLVIYDLPNLVSFAECGLPPNLRDFSIDNCCERLRPSSLGEYWGLQGLFSLEEFSIGGRGSDDILERLFKEQLLPPNLHTLHINTLSSLKSLDINGLGHLTSLQQLHISGCDSLEFLPRLRHLTCLQQLHISGCPSLEFQPEEGLPPSLFLLNISCCSALEKRYENKTEQDWANISHIPCINITGLCDYMI